MTKPNQSTDEPSNDECGEGDVDEFDGLPEPELSRAALAENVSRLQRRVAELEDRMKEHCFWALVLAAFVFDCLFFTTLDNSAAILCIFGLEVAVLTVAAKRLGVEEVTVLIDKILSLFRRPGQE